VDLLRRFADRFAIEYHLLCDADSAVIDAFGIRNTNIPEDHDWYGVPLPGMYLVDEDGRVFDKHFAADHAVRESVNSALQERFAVDIGHDGLVTAGAEGVTVRSWFSTPTIRRAQMTVLTVELNLAPGLHLYGRPLPAGYIPVELQVDGGEGLVVQQIAYPRARPRRFEVLDETLPAYENSVQLKAHCLGMAREGTVDVSVTVRYQACDSTECYLPERLTFDMNLDVLGHVAERV
jgi:DsbC/DsbD-like thiol-disulfide interchange protein